MRRAASGSAVNGPITVRTPEGRQLTISRSSLYFDESGVLKADDWPLYAEHKDLVNSLLASLVSSRHLVPGAVLSSSVLSGETQNGTAMIFQSAEVGTSGNLIQVAFANLVPDEAEAANTRFDVTVTRAEKYAALSDDPNSDKFLKKVLGTDKNAGAEPGLVHPLEAEEPTRPRAGQYALTGGGVSKKSRAQIPGAEGDAFTLEAGATGKDGDNILVTVSEVKGRTFTLAAVWEKKGEGLTVADLPDKLPGYGVLLTATAPDGGFALPHAGTFKLSGGSGTARASVSVPR